MNTPSDLPAVAEAASGRSVTFTELHRQSQQLGSALQALGLSEGDKVAFMLNNQIEFAVVLKAARESGFDHLPLNTHSKIDELTEIMGQLNPAAVIVDRKFAAAASALTNQLGPHVHRIMVGNLEVDGWHSFEALLGKQECRAPITPTQKGRLLLLSGGSTGTPKIVMKPHSKMRSPQSPSKKTSPLALASNDVVLLPAPLYHAMPVRWLASALGAGAQVILMEQRDGEEILRAIDVFKITVLPLTPTMMKRMLNVSEEQRKLYDVSGLRMVIHGGAPCPQNVKQSFMEWIGCVWELYGMSEGFGGTMLSPDGWLQKPGSVGKPVEGSRIVIRNDQGEELPAGEMGIVWFARPPGGQMAYVGREEETDACYNEHGEGTALDNGFVDEDGYLFLVGRSKNVLNVGGAKVFPTRIEAVLERSNAVADVCVVGIPHHDLGEVPAAVIELSQNTPACTGLKESLAELCRNSLGSLATPQRWTFVEKLPRTPTGKVQLSTIQALVN
jgi:acyl-coenzyme A synthetase/AMP-(fatty) acid ligase